MNIVSQRTATARAQQGIAVPTVRLPIYVRLMLMLLTVMVALTAGWAALFRQSAPLSNPFSDYGEILPGQPWNAIAAARFSCDPGNSTPPEYCSRTLTGGPFSLVSVSLSDGVVSRANFSVHDGALTVGDLALLWGRPNVHLYRQSVNLDWPTMGINANGWAENWQFSYSIPIQRISFTLTS